MALHRQTVLGQLFDSIKRHLIYEGLFSYEEPFLFSSHYRSSVIQVLNRDRVNRPHACQDACVHDPAEQ